jgi:hypothetical protein
MDEPKTAKDALAALERLTEEYRDPANDVGEYDILKAAKRVLTLADLEGPTVLEKLVPDDQTRNQIRRDANEYDRQEEEGQHISADILDDEDARSSASPL